MAEWTPATKQRLRDLWAEGLSTSEIGWRMGFSKNAIVGAAHRLNLDGRPSPIRSGGNAAPRRSRPKVRGATLPALPSAATLPAVAPPQVLTPAPPTPVVTTPERPAMRSSHAGARLTPCCWPIGEPGTSSFHFCEAGSVVGRPYCEAHLSQAFVKVRGRREDHPA